MVTVYRGHSKSSEHLWYLKIVALKNAIEALLKLKAALCSWGLYLR